MIDSIDSKLTLSILNTLPNPVLIKGSDLKYIWVNSAFEELFNIKCEDMCGKLDIDLFPNRQAAQCNGGDKRVLATGEIDEAHETIFKDGVEPRITITRKNRLEIDGKDYLIGIMHDITETTNANKELEKRRKQLESQKKLSLMGEMIGNIAHQWRQPLSVISSSVTGLQLLNEFDEMSNEEFEQKSAVINEQTQYLSKTIEVFRNYIENDDSNKKTFSLKDIIEQAIRLLESLLESNKIEIIVDYKEDIEIIGYPNALIQCFINIINNSIHALNENNIEEKYIFITKQINDDEVTISFKDNGGGMSIEILEKIFEPYFTTKHPSIGTGLGLSLTYNLIVNTMGGIIEAENVKFSYNKKEFTGTNIIINLPKTKI